MSVVQSPLCIARLDRLSRKKTSTSRQVIRADILDRARELEDFLSKSSMHALAFDVIDESRYYSQPRFLNCAHCAACTLINSLLSRGLVVIAVAVVVAVVMP